MQKNSMLKISQDKITRAIHKDIHADMEEKGVENFFEHGGEILCVEPNTLRNLMKKGNFTIDHLISVKNKTKAKHLSEEILAKFGQ